MAKKMTEQLKTISAKLDQYRWAIEELKKLKSWVANKVLTCLYIGGRYIRIRKLRNHEAVKIYYGCGHVSQHGYINADFRLTPAVDIIGSLEWFVKHLRGKCQEVYISHLLEHYDSPGKISRATSNTVLGALNNIYDLLKPGGVIRIAVPDFAAIVKLYCEEKEPLYPRLLGRLVGEQNYIGNKHSCVFDKVFLEKCLTQCGFEKIETWDPCEHSFEKDGSFDEVHGVRTSLNLVAKKPS